MAFLRIDAIITKVYDLLRLDAKTVDIDWYNGRRAAARIQKMPAGNVFLGSGVVRSFTMPAGEDASLRIVVELFYASHEGAPDAEKALRDGLDLVAQVLVDTWALGLSYAYPEGLSWEATINPETTPPYASARLLLDVKSIPGD